MAVQFSYPGEQNVKPGGVIVFSLGTAVDNNDIARRENTGVITLMNGKGRCGCRNDDKAFLASFGANITFPATPVTGETAATAPISVAFAIGGEPDVATEMTVTPAAAGEFYNVSRSRLVTVSGGCCTQIAIENTSNGSITVSDATLCIVDA